MAREVEVQCRGGFELSRGCDLQRDRAAAAADGAGRRLDIAGTSTTVAAGVDQKPLTGKQTSVTGQIVDLSCYLQLGKHGEKHASCGKKCIANGQPIGLVTKAGQVYMLMEKSTTRGATDRPAFASSPAITSPKMAVSGTVQGYAGQ